MDEKEKQTEQEKPADTSTEAAAETAETPEGGAPVKQKNKRLINALIRIGAALIIAALLLTVSKFSIFDLIKGPTETEAAHHEETGTFVKQDVALILGDLSDQGLPKNYAIAVIYDKIVVVRFTDRYLESADAIKTDTLQYVDGTITTIDKYVTVEGTIEKQSEELSTKVYEWYAANKSWMLEKGVVADTGDDSVYISDAVLTVDTVNSMSEALVYALTGLAALCLLYIIVELVLMASGFYLKEQKKKKADEGSSETEESGEEAEESGEEAEESGEEAEESGEEAEESGEDSDEEKTSEDAEECIKDEEKPENNGSSETEESEEDK